MLIIYVVLSWILIPIAYEWTNRKVTADNRVVSTIKGWPSWALNLIICVLVSLVIFALPGVNLNFSFTNLFLLLSAIYIGKDSVFNTIIKPFFQTRMHANLKF